MTTPYDGSIAFAGGSFDYEVLIEQLTNHLPVKHTFHLTGAGYSAYASGSTTTLASLAVDCEDDELILFYTAMQVSCGTASSTPGASSIVHIRHKVDAAAQGDDFFEPPSNYVISSTGTGKTLRILSFWSGLTGSKTFELQWQNDGAGTIYSVSQRLHAVQFKLRT